MTSMIDVMVVCVVFLLLTFSSNSECACRRDLSRLPPAENVSDLVDGPVVFVTASGILVDGLPVEAEADLRGARGQRLDKTYATLKQKHDLAKSLAAGRPPPSHVILAIEGDVPAGVVKSVSRTAASSGYPDLDFMVNAAK